MPRRTPVRELLKEETVPSSPLRRSSRISNSSPVPTKVVSRRNSATETSVATPKATRSRRSSLSQDQEAEAPEVEADKKPVKTPRTRRASLTTNNEESAKTEEETVAKGKTPDSKKPVTRRRRSTSLDPEAIEEEPVKKTRSRSASASKTGESVEDAKSKTKPSENGHSEVDEDIDDQSKSNVPKKKKMDTLKVDLDLSVIKEGSFIEDEEGQEGKEITKEDANKSIVEEKKSEPVSTKEESVATKDAKLDEETIQAEKKPTDAVATKRITSLATKKSEDKDETPEEKPVENSLAEEKEKSGATIKKTENSVDSTKGKSVVETEEASMLEEKNSIIAIQLEDEKLAEENKAESCAPTIKETAGAKEGTESNIEKQTPETTADIKEKAASATKEDAEEKVEDGQIEEEKFDSPSVLKENSAAKELSDASFSDTSFNLQLSNSVLDDVNKTGVNLSPTSNKENVRPQQKSEEPAPEPMEVDESYSEIPSPSKLTRKSMNATKVPLELDDVEKKLEIAEKVTDEIAQFLTEGMTPEAAQSKKTDIPKIVLTISEATEDSTKETTVDMSTVEYEKPIKEVTDIAMKQSQVTKQTEESAKEKDASVVIAAEAADSLSDSNISLAIDEESTDLAKTNEISSSEDPKASENVTPQKKEDAETSPADGDSIKDKAMESSRVTDEDLSVSLNDSDVSTQKTTEGFQEKTVEQTALEKSSVEAEDCKQENNSVESAEIQKEVTETPVISDSTEERREVSPRSKVQKEEAENSPRNNVSVTEEIQENSVNQQDTSVEDMKLNEETSAVAESQASDVEKKELEESEEEIVVDDEGDIVGYGEKESNENIEQEVPSEGNNRITASSPFLNKSELEDDEDSSIAVKTVHEETPDEPCLLVSYHAPFERAEIEVRHDIYERDRSSREIVILSDDENAPDKVEEENGVSAASDEEVEFVREDLDPTVVKVSPRNDNEVNIQETLSVEKVNSLNSSKSWVDKTTFVMQETLRAEEDKETSLRDRIHKVVDLFCSEIKNKGDISINVSLECTGQNSDVSDHESSIKHGVSNAEAESSAVEEVRDLFPKGSKRRKLYHLQNYDPAMFSENTPEYTTKQPEDKSSQKKKKKKRKLHKKTTEGQDQSKEESEKQETASPKKKMKKQKSSSPAESHSEELPPPKKKSKKQKSATVTESHEEAVSPTKKAKKRKDDTDKIEESEDQDKNKKPVSKTKNKRLLDQEISEEQKEMIPNRNENVEEAYSSPFSTYFSSSFNIDDSEDENDVTYQPSRDLNSSDSDLITDESIYTEYSSSEELEETEESYSYAQKTDGKKNKKESKRLLYSSEDNENAVASSGSENVFMGQDNTKQDTSKAGNKKHRKSKQKWKNEQSDASDEGVLQSSMKKGRKVKQPEGATMETSPNTGKKTKKRTHTYTVSDEEEESVPERKIKKEKFSPLKPTAKVAAEKVMSPENAKKVPNAETRIGKKVNKKNFKLKPSTAAASGWDVETV